MDVSRRPRKLMKTPHFPIMLPQWGTRDGLRLIMEFTGAAKTDPGFRISGHGSWLQHTLALCLGTRAFTFSDLQGHYL